MVNYCYIQLIIQVCQEALKTDINLIDYKPQVSTGYTCKITDSKGKYHIGSKIDYKKRWKQHEEAGENMLLHRAIKIKESKPFNLN